MLRLLTVLVGLSGLLAALAGLMLSATITPVELLPQPTLAKFLGWATRNRPLFLLLAVTGAVVSYGAMTFRDLLNVQPAIALSDDTKKEPPKATAYGSKQEIEEMPAERAKEAADYFESAERDYVAERYRDAASTYRKSINVLPTMSAYLNLGNTL